MSDDTMVQNVQNGHDPVQTKWGWPLKAVENMFPFKMMSKMQNVDDYLLIVYPETNKVASKWNILTRVVSDLQREEKLE